MLPRYLLAPTLLFAWQVAPVGIVRDESGGLRVAFGAALGDYEEQTLNCAGEVTEQQTVTFSTVGGSAEYRPANTAARVEVHAGRVSPEESAGAVSGSVIRGWYATGLMAIEDQRFGLGFGLASVPKPVFVEDLDADRAVRPTGYVRVGRTARIHARFDMNTPETPGTTPDRLRFSVGRGWGAANRVSWRLSLSEVTFPATSEDEVRFGAAIAVPTGRGFLIGASVSSFDSGKSAGLFAQYTYGWKGSARP